MQDAIRPLTEKLATLDKRVDRLRAELESAEKDRADVQTAIRVVTEITGQIAPPVKPQDVEEGKSSRPASEKKALMLDLIGVGQSKGKQPAEVHAALRNRNIFDISIEVVRTTLWRAAKKGEIGSGDGYYWKFAETVGGEDAESHPPTDSNPSAGLTSSGTLPFDRSSG